MSKLYYMRHGQTLFNELRRKQGWCDSPLTELGVEQAKRAGDFIRERGITFDHAYCSTSERAIDTLEIAFPGLAYERDKQLKEWYFGKYEGITEDLNPPLPYGDFYKTYGGEGELELRERLMKRITEIMKQPEHESVLCVSHGAATAQILRALGYDWTKEGKRIGNCAIAELDFDGEVFTVVDLYNPND